jgi:hypothetical protein
MGKYIIIDKDVFEGTQTDKLVAFVQNHFLILPDDLYYECATTDTNREKLLDRFRSVVLAGAYICPRVIDIIKKEAKNLSPCGFLVDLDKVPAVIRTFKKNKRPYNPQIVQRLQKEEMDMAKRLLCTAEGFNAKLASDEPELLAKVRKWDNSTAARSSRLQELTEFIDTQDMHESALKWLSGLVFSPEKFCLSKDWFSWEYSRLLHILIQERTFLRHCGGMPSDNAIEHDLQDIKYVALLSRANCLLTKDEKLVKPLAKTAFPERDVFSNLDEVPEEYVCHWS